MILDVQITQHDIDTGEPTHPYGCPVALAVKRACQSDDTLKQFHPVVIAGSVKFRLGDDGRYVQQSYFKEVDDFTFAFDDGRTVHPISFKLEIKMPLFKERLADARRTS